MTSLTLIRGLPGSGKSTLAKKLKQQKQQQGVIVEHLEADMFFMNDQNEYCFDPLLLEDAHKWCQSMTKAYLQAGQSVIVSNTFVCHWEMVAYQKIAKQLKVPIKVIVCRNNFGTIHNISAKTLNEMSKRWQE